MIGPENILIISSVVLLLTVAGLILDRTWFGRQIPSAVTIMVIAIFLSNLGVLPHSSPVYDFVLSQFVPAGIVLLLLQSRLKTIMAEARPVLIAFVVAVMATLAGVACAVAIVDFGKQEAIIAGVFAATYTGGAMNFVAVSQMLGFTDPDLYASALAADTAVGAVFFMGLVLLSSGLFMKGGAGGDVTHGNTYVPTNQSAVMTMDRLGRLAVAVIVSFLITRLSGIVASILSFEQFTILFMTLFALAVANIFPKQIERVGGIQHLGMAVMYAFFVAVGFGADFTALTGSAIQFVEFAAIILGVHIAIIAVCGLVFQLPLRELLVASNACVLGPATAAGMAASRGWMTLVTPGLFAGVLGYTIANFVGAGVAMILGWR